MKRFLIVTLFLLSFMAQGSLAFSENPAPEELFSTRGTLVQVNPEAKTLRVKTQGGLQVTFHVENEIKILAGEETKSLADLRPDDPLQIEYLYDENYEKVARSVKIETRAASGKTSVPPT